MATKNYINTDGNGNIILQDVTGQNITINDISAIKKAFVEAEPEFIKTLYAQIDDNYNKFVKQNIEQTDLIVALLKDHIKQNNITVEKSKNILTGSISGVGGNVQLGDTIINKTNLLPVYIVLIFVLILVLFLLFKNDILRQDQQTETQETIQIPIDTNKTTEQNIEPTTTVQPEEKIHKTVISQKLALNVTTNKGSKPIFRADDKVRIKYKLNKSAYVRIIYLMADSSAVLLADNLYVEADMLNKYIQTPYNFVCAEPFGTEKLVAYAQAIPFEKLNTKIQYGYEFITQSIYSAYETSEKGLKKEIEFTKIELTVITKSKND